MMSSLTGLNFKKARGISSSLLALCFVLGMGLVVSAPSAEAQSTRDLNNRINRLENEMQTLSRAMFRGEEPPAGAFSSGGDARANADTVVRLQQMEQELSTLRGMVEEQGHEVRQMREELRRVSEDMALRLQDLEAGRGAANPAVQSGQAGALKYTTRSPSLENDDPQDVGEVQASDGGYQWSANQGRGGNLGSYTESPDTGEVSGGADLAAATYENAFSLLKGNQYEAAQKDFEIFLNQYPNHPLAGNAQYWLGETHYVRGDFEQAAKVFAVGYQKYPKGAKAADNLLKLGMSLSALGKTGDACVALSQISKEGFSSAEPVMRRAEQEKSRLNCS